MTRATLETLKRIRNALDRTPRTSPRYARHQRWSAALGEALRELTVDKRTVDDVQCAAVDEKYDGMTPDDSSPLT